MKLTGEAEGGGGGGGGIGAGGAEIEHAAGHVIHVHDLPTNCPMSETANSKVEGSFVRKAHALQPEAFRNE